MLLVFVAVGFWHCLFLTILIFDTAGFLTLLVLALLILYIRLVFDAASLDAAGFDDAGFWCCRFLTLQVFDAAGFWCCCFGCCWFWCCWFFYAAGFLCCWFFYDAGFGCFVRICCCFLKFCVDLDHFDVNPDLMWVLHIWILFFLFLKGLFVLMKTFYDNVIM